MNEIKTMKSQNSCPECGSPLSKPGAECTVCLLQLGLTIPGGGVGSPPGAPSNAPEKSMVRLRYFGDYELLEEIARGGMGVVYKAKQVTLNRLVAVKMILNGALANEAELTRFRTEAEAAANLRHPNIVSIHEVGEHEGQTYFSMDLVEGGNLSQRISAGRLLPVEAAALVKTVAEAIHYAHQRGVLHRDLKPQNLLLDQAGAVYVTDFGLAKQMESGQNLTQSGELMGTPGYMSPEQATGRLAEIGPATDVYSLGAILYELLTGQPPFKGENAWATIAQVTHDMPVPPRKLDASIPIDLEHVCLKCLEKRPEHRYSNARQLAEDLDRVLNHRPVLAKPPGKLRQLWAWVSRHPWILTGLGAVLVLSLGGLTFGLFEQTRFLRSLNHPELRLGPWLPQLTDKQGFYLGAAMLGAFWTSVICFLDFALRRARKQTVTGRYLAVTGTIGAAQTIFALMISAVSISEFVWKSGGSWHSFLLQIVFMPFFIGWFGLVLLWNSIFYVREQWYGARPQDELDARKYVKVDWNEMIPNMIAGAMVLHLVAYAILQYTVEPPVQTLTNGHVIPMRPDETRAWREGVRGLLGIISVLWGQSFWLVTFLRRGARKATLQGALFALIMCVTMSFAFSGMLSWTLRLEGLTLGLLYGGWLIKVSRMSPAEREPGKLMQIPDLRKVLRGLLVLMVGFGLIAWLVYRQDLDRVLHLFGYLAQTSILPLLASSITRNHRVELARKPVVWVIILALYAWGVLQSGRDLTPVGTIVGLVGGITAGILAGRWLRKA